MQLEGKAIQWHLAFMRYRQYLQPATWTKYVMALVEIFGIDFDDPMEEIKKIRQMGTVKEYQAAFEKNLTRVNLSQENSISYFLGGLKHELNIAIKLTNPTTLSQVYKTARIQEAYLAAIRLPSSTRNVPANAPRRVMDQRNNSRPLLPTPSQEPEEGLFLEELVNELEEQDMELTQPMEQMGISIHALNGSLGYKILTVTGYHFQKPLHILVDTGSSHNFMDPELVEILKCPVRATTPQLVAVANGNMLKVDKVCKISWLLQGAEFFAEFLLLPLGSCGVVLGVQWLLTLGDIKINFRTLTMEFYYKGRKHVLRGSGKQILTPGAGKLARISGKQSELCMIQVMLAMCNEVQCCSLETKETFEQDPKLLNLLNEFKELSKEPTQLPPSRGVFDHRIVLQTGTEPINKRSYSLVGKKYGTWRLCVNYRDLNKQTVKNKFPIPIVEDLLDELGGSKIFSKIDLRSGYHQLRMAVKDVPKTTFRTHAGHYVYLAMPFGLSNAPATFQGLMNSVFQKLLRKYVLVFFDDILIYNSNMDDHLLHLKSVFGEMKKHQLFFAKQSKCFFEIEAVKEWPLPTNVKKLRGFLGLAGYYRSFIRGFGSISKSLTDLLKKDNFKWSPAASEAFEQLKTALIQAPMLALPDANKTFIVETDASGHGIGVVLMQQGHPIAFIRKTLSPRHAALLVYDRELLAIVYAITKWSQYLLGQRFIIRTDQRAVKFLIEQKLQINFQLMWLTKLMPFDYVIGYKKGVENKVADALSRVLGGELFSLVIFTTSSELLQAIFDSWNSDADLKTLN
uniref:Uncharacterized protein LOC104232193 n=1 Tax=Nicotiana sylvestris TaxID=4096 RepID=A0A1U7X1T9_NICSY|nr:PREDICTED: uncharacterized protein LOC104232193 [Nicotiana sylvestris]